MDSFLENQCPAPKISICDKLKIKTIMIALPSTLASPQNKNLISKKKIKQQSYKKMWICSTHGIILGIQKNRYLGQCKQKISQP